MLIDGCGRAIDYLRLSVTARCNLRCEYCLPAEGYRPAPDRLSDGEVVRLVGAFARLGVRRVRVTGGEPLVRPGIVGLVARLAALPGLSEVSLSTNGVLLAPLAARLREAGLSRVNISLDTLDPERFRAVTRRGDLAKVLEGIEAALSAGLDPVKLNMVVVRGVNLDEVARLAGLARERPLHVRFIELMPVGETGYFSKSRWVGLPEIRALCGALEPAGDSAPEGAGPARYWRAPGGRGTVGFISALSSCFCDSCNRLRLSADGRLYPCLAAENCVDLRPALAEAGEDGLERAIRAAVAAKPARHRMDQVEDKVKDSFMCALGG